MPHTTFKYFGSLGLYSIFSRMLRMCTMMVSVLTASALAACGGGGGDPAPSTASTTGTTAATPAAAPAPAPAPAPASSGYPTGNAIRGKALWTDLPNTTLSCDGCHGPAVAAGPAQLAAANNPELIARAISNNAGGVMRVLAFPVLNGQDLADIAAYLVTPGI